jgi:hypothetical protein
VIQITEITVRGQSDAGPFAGEIRLSPGLQVITARNAYGKSLAVTAVAWCLGAEAVLGNPDNDSSCFPEAVRVELEILHNQTARVLSSECSIRIADQNGRQLQLTRAIKGDSRIVRVKEWSTAGESRESKLSARQQAMQDEHGGLQHFLFEWMKWPRAQVATFRGAPSEIYLENLVPLFYIDQDEGWTNIQALQITRYGQQEIAQIAIEYLLGAVDAVRARVARQEANQKNFVMRETARQIAERVSATFLRRGWRVEWSGNGSLSDILTRWASRTVREALKQDANIDLSVEEESLKAVAERFRKALTTEPIDSSDASVPAATSQRVIDLKNRRHELSEELHSMRVQRELAAGLDANLEHRIMAASDLLRLKTTGVGRLEHLECPTCHRELDPSTFNLTAQSSESVSTHIEALKRDRELIRKNLFSIDASMEIGSGALLQVEDDLRDAERTLMNVTNSIGTVREQLAKIASDLNRAERSIERIRETSREIDELQSAIDKWIAEVNALGKLGVATPDFEQRRNVFLDAVRRYLLALGHSAVRQENQASLNLDDQYVPTLNDRRLRALGSSSDQARLVAAYSLALAAASDRIGGLHPGFVILDEPLQQNPDPHHHDLFIEFLTKELARTTKFQTLIFTSLSQDEIGRLQQGGTNVLIPEGDHFLKLVPTTALPRP